MAIEEILVALDAQAEAEIGRIVDEACTEVNEIVDAAKHDAEKAASTYIAGAVGEAQMAAERERNAELAAYRRDAADVRREVFEEVFVRAARQIQEIRLRGEYPAIMGRLVADATSDLGDNYILHVDPRDKNLVSDVCKGMACALDIETAGGAMVTSADGRIKRSSTFEDRLQRIRENYIELISEVLNT